MLFSVIIPVYNADRFIENCIKSVLNQDEQDFELVIINDGSKDKSQDIINKYAETDKRINVINQPNMGLFYSRCTGIENSNGKYIVFLDADDTLKSNALRKLKSAICYFDIDIIIYKSEKIYPSGKRCTDKKEFENNTIFTNENKYILYERILKGSSLNQMWKKAIKKSCFKIDNLKTYPRITMSEDLLHTLRPLTNAKKIKYIDEDLYNYQINNASMSRIFDPNVYMCIKFIHKELFTYIKEWNINTFDGTKMVYKRFLRGVGGAIMYSPSDNKGKELEYIKVLESIRGDEMFAQAYTKSYDTLSLINKIPIWLLIKGKYKTLFTMKFAIARVRRKINFTLKN